MIATFRPYGAVYAMRFALLLQYRVAALAGFATQLWWGTMKILVFAAFYRSAPVQPLTLADAVTYVWLGQAFLTVLPWNADPEIAQMAETGNVGYERLKPVDTYAYWFARAIAWRTATPLLRALPMLALAALVLRATGPSAWRWRMPPTVSAACLFAFSMFLAVCLSAAITVLTNIFVTAVRTSRGVSLLNGSVTVLSGMVVPLALMPSWMQPLLFWQPCAGLVDIPYRVYFGNLAGEAAARGLFAQTLWVVLLVAAGRLFMTHTMARIDM